MRKDVAAVRRRRQQLRVLGILLALLGLIMHSQGSPWTPLAFIIGGLILSYVLRKPRYDSES